MIRTPEGRLRIVRAGPRTWHLVNADGNPLMIGDEGCTATTRRACHEEVVRRQEHHDPAYWLDPTQLRRLP